MKAAIWTAYGEPEVIKFQEVKTPTPKSDQVLVRVESSAVTSGDCRMRRFDIPKGMRLPSRLAFGVFKPRKNILGMNFSGEVVAVGKRVSQFNIGDRVLGSTGMALGANAEFLCIAEGEALVRVPDSISHTDAVSLIFGGVTALHFLKGIVKQGNNVLINGASGSVGSAAVQLSKYYGANVSGVCSSSNKEWVLTLGADEVIDYTTTDFTKEDQKYDVILDTVGNLSYSKCKTSLTQTGRLILINAGLGTMLQSLFNNKLVCGVAQENKVVLQEVLDLLLSENLKPTIDRVYPLDEIEAAHRYVDTGHKKGNVVLTTENGSV